MFEDTQGVSEATNRRTHNNMDNKTNYIPQNTTQKTKDWTTVQTALSSFSNVI
jgi:hypothetical protein